MGAPALQQRTSQRARFRARRVSSSLTTMGRTRGPSRQSLNARNGHLGRRKRKPRCERVLCGATDATPKAATLLDVPRDHQAQQPDSGAGAVRGRRRRPARNKCHFAVTGAEHGPAQLPEMSFQDDAVEPLAVESAAHFMELLRRAGAREPGERYFDGRDGERRDRSEAGRALPRELGN